ncbi:MAG: PHP domain-containing protein [Candidatus Nanohalobium sp.]
MKDSKVTDLHMHTSASDGTDSVQERIEDAAEKGLDAIALTDHDTINPGLDERVYVDDEAGVEVITGAEIKCEVQGSGIEILSYFLDPNSDEINSLLEKNSQLREQRIKDMIGNLNEVLDYDLTEEEVFDQVEGNPGRPHVADALEKAGAVDTQQEAFDEYIGEDCPAYIPTPKQDAEEVIETVLEDGGVPVLAHPGRDLEESEAEDIVEELVGYGLKGIEVMYSWEHKKANNFGISFAEEKCRELAEEYDLIWTGGSDCHGSGSDKYLIGSVELPYSHVERLKERADAAV